MNQGPDKAPSAEASTIRAELELKENPPVASIGSLAGAGVGGGNPSGIIIFSYII
jgi:hypothetical protein